MKNNNQVQEILTEVFDTHELLNKLWGYPAEDIIAYLKNKGVQLDFSVLGFRGGFDRIGWYKFTDTLPKEAWIDAITLKPKFKSKNYATGSNTRFTESELKDAVQDYRTVYLLTAKFKNKKNTFQTEFENYHYVLSCECIAWLRREKLLNQPVAQ